MIKWNESLCYGLGVFTGVLIVYWAQEPPTITLAILEGLLGFGVWCLVDVIRNWIFPS